MIVAVCSPMINSSNQEKRIKQWNLPEGPIPNYQMFKKPKVRFKQNACADPTPKQTLDQ